MKLLHTLRCKTLCIGQMQKHCMQSKLQSRAYTHCPSLACTPKRESSSEPAIAVAVPTLCCRRFVRAAIAAFLKASCSMMHELSPNMITDNVVFLN